MPNSIVDSSVASQRRFAGDRKLLLRPPVNVSRLQTAQTAATEKLPGFTKSELVAAASK